MTKMVLAEEDVERLSSPVQLQCWFSGAGRNDSNWCDYGYGEKKGKIGHILSGLMCVG